MAPRLLIIAATVLLSGIFTIAHGQSVHLLESGTTSVRLDPTFLLSADLTVTNVTTTGEAAPEFDAGFPILDSTDFSFQIDAGFKPLAGSVLHSGSVQFDQGPLGIFSVGNFEIAYGAVAPGKLELFDKFLGTRLFEVTDPGSSTVTGNDFEFGTSDLIVTPEFAAFLLNGGLSGQVAGQLRIDGVVSSTPVPEPRTALLAAASLILLGARRRRPQGQFCR